MIVADAVKLSRDSAVGEPPDAIFTVSDSDELSLESPIKS